ncbi:MULTISPECIES: hypothetical protein [Gordonia]|uniref:hypothetical protein n=1 Tax=Gordonia TaxID=2053 RepID=UPI000990A023|nr:MULTISPECIES: hypothetical protein [Gordonia]MBR7193430.1 hypothetical protein [Gordonia sp. SCSIO 19800]MCX2753872.1 hypothetical protein [Gordonia sp. 4N]UPG67685.1 hypothetical protein MVF96_20070 [Gordonia hongkongensis]
MRQADGEYYVTAGELQAFWESGHDYWYMREDGSTDLYADELDITHGWPIFLMKRDEEWFAKWDGDFERAVDDDLNPKLIRHFEELITEGNWPHRQD